MFIEIINPNEGYKTSYRGMVNIEYVHQIKIIRGRHRQYELHIIVKPTINFTLARLGNLASERVYSRNCCSLKCKHIFGFYYNLSNSPSIELLGTKEECERFYEELQEVLKTHKQLSRTDTLIFPPQLPSQPPTGGDEEEV